MPDQDHSPGAVSARPRIAVFAGPNATVLNSEPLVTSDKARAARGLPLRLGPDGRLPRFDALRPQRLAAPVTVYVEQFSAHPLERDAAHLYAPPDGYVGRDGVFRRERSSADDVPAYEVRLDPADGVYPLPYMAFQADGRPWEGDEADPFGPPERARQPFYPDASRVFEEIDRLGVGEDGLAGHLDALGEFDFYRPAPPGGYTGGLAEDARTDVGSGDVRPEERGRDFFPYRPVHLIRQPSRLALARLTNVVQEALASGGYAGGLWLEGSPYLEETLYWLGLLVDTSVPLAGCAAQRAHGLLGADGDRNIVDAVRYLVSGIWADEQGRDGLGAVVVMDQLIFAARAVQKADARPGGYVATGGHGGIMGSITSVDRLVLSWRPVRRHTWRSAVRLSQLADEVGGVRRLEDGRIGAVPVAVRDGAGRLLETAIPSVALVKHGQYGEESEDVDPTREVAIVSRIERYLRAAPLAGFVAEGSAPYGTVNESAEQALRTAVFAGMPVVKVARGNADGFVEKTYAPFAIAAGNLSASKARLLLMACLLRFGALPAAADPAAPTGVEIGATGAALDRYQEVFDTH